MTAVLALVLACTLTLSCAASFNFGSLLSGMDWSALLSGDGDWSALLGGDPARMFFNILNMLTTKDDKKTYTETPLEPIQYTEAELARRQKIVDLINGDLNRIKTQKPAFRITTQKGLPGTNGASVDGFLQRGTTIADSIFRLLYGDEKKPVNSDTVLESLGVNSFFAETTTEQHKTGVPCDDIVSVSGQPYVSMLRAEDVYTENPITKSRYNDSYEFKLYLQDAVNPGPDSAQARVFDLFSDVKLYQTLSKFVPNIDQDILSIRYVDCYIEGVVDRYGNVQQYATHYKCILKVDSSVAGLDLSQYTTALGDKEIYESYVIYSNFDWEARKLGDLTNDGLVNSADARLLLRIASRLVEQEEDSLTYGDLNFDGKINSADARILLRVCARLQEMPKRPEPPAEES